MQPDTEQPTLAEREAPNSFFGRLVCRALTGPGVFAILFCAALAFALFTQNAWEDYYITYRSSANLAHGLGLVYTPGERLHTFTSPLGVLLPALASLLTFNSSDAGALWIFRIMSAAAYAGAGALVFSVLKRHAEDRTAPVARCGAFALLGALLLLEGKALAFTINGMETGFMLLAVAGTVDCLLARDHPRRWVHTGLWWAMLLWTRPDSFVYIGALGAAVLVFGDRATSGPRLRSTFITLLKAAALAAILYLPWLVFAHLYYGSAVPHTIVAKGLSQLSDKNLLGVWHTLVGVLVHGAGTIPDTGLPAYAEMGGWPLWLEPLFRRFGQGLSLLWIVPWFRRTTRIASFAFVVSQVYLSYFPNYPYPWYFPPAYLLGALAFAAALIDVASIAKSHVADFPVRLAMLFPLIACVALTLLVALGAARQLREQQRLVENQNRRAIGEWLKKESSAGDSVFLEPLGYVGFFSGLKMYDFPGLSSKEVVAARKRVGDDWPRLIGELQPTWLVLRPKEIARLTAADSALLTQRYTPQAQFSCAKELAASSVPGRPFLAHDESFTVFRRAR